MPPMPIFLDEEPMTEGELTRASDLAGLLSAARRILQPQKRVVVEVQVDGQILTGEQIVQQHTLRLDEHRVDLFSASPVSLAIEVLDQMRLRLAENAALQKEAAELLQEDQASAALGRVGESIEVWLQAEQAVRHATGLVEVNLDAIELDGEDFGYHTRELLSHLQTLKELIVADDVVGLADVLAYEWPEVTDRWDRLLGAIVDRIEAVA